MSRSIRILSLALDDLAQGRAFYERQQPGIGDYFLDTLFSDVEALLIHAGVHERHFGYHRALSKRFPYAIYYRLAEDEIQVWRILDCRRNPRWIRRSLVLE